MTRLPEAEEAGAPSNGYLIAHRSGDLRTTVYWTGDTLWTSEARRIKDKVDTVDVVIPNIGAVGGTDDPKTLTGKEAMQFVFLAQPKRIVPIGYHTFSHYTEGVDDFKRRIGLTLYERRLVVLKEGETFEREK